MRSDILKEEFNYVSRACNPDLTAQQSLFNEIIEKENRLHEPWALHALRLLSADTREPQNNGYIPQSLDALTYIQQTSDIFFANNWLNALLGSHKSHEALRHVESKPAQQDQGGSMAAEELQGKATATKEITINI